MDWAWFDDENPSGEAPKHVPPPPGGPKSESDGIPLENLNGYASGFEELPSLDFQPGELEGEEAKKAFLRFYAQDEKKYGEGIIRMCWDPISEPASVMISLPSLKRLIASYSVSKSRDAAQSTDEELALELLLIGKDVPIGDELAEYLGLPFEPFYPNPGRGPCRLKPPSNLKSEWATAWLGEQFAKALLEGKAQALAKRLQLKLKKIKEIRAAMDGGFIPCGLTIREKMVVETIAELTAESVRKKYPPCPPSRKEIMERFENKYREERWLEHPELKKILDGLQLAWL